MKIEDTILPSMAKVFQTAQHDKPLHSHLISKLTHIFGQTDVKTFATSFITCVKIIFINPQDNRTCATQALEFALKFLIFLIDEDSKKNETPSNKVVQFWTSLFNFLNENHSNADTRVRKRVCQFISKFMLLMSPDAELDCKICEIITDIMKERIKDRIPMVRQEAILSVYRLQDTSNVNCSVSKMLLNCIETDTAADVRKLALSKISLKQKGTVRILINRVDDVSEKVRKTLYLVFSKLHPLHFNAEERKRLLYTGLYDDSECVKNVVKHDLLPAWFKRMDNDYIKFLRMFDLIFDSSKFVTKILMFLFESTPDELNRETMNSCLNEMLVIPHDQLTCENTFYWRCYVFWLSDVVNEKGDYEWQPGQSYDGHAVGLLPDLSDFCEYMKSYHSLINREREGAEKWKRREQEFIFVQFVELCKSYDYADEVGRRNLQNLCLDLLQEVHIQTVKPIIQLYFMLRTNLNESIIKVTNEINNLLHPSTSQTLLPSGANDSESSTVSNKLHTATLTVEQENSLKFKMAKLEVRLEELNDLQEEAIKMQDFTKAESLKNEISFIREQISLLKESIYCKPMSVCYEEYDDDIMIVDEDDQDEIANPLENIQPDTVLRCVTILSEMLNLSVIKHLTPELRALLQDFVLHACKSSSPVIAPLATELLGSFCLRDNNLAKEYFIPIFSLCGNTDIYVSALRVTFDLLTCFGPKTFNITSLDAAEDYNKAEYAENVSNASSAASTDNEAEKEDDAISGYAFISTLIKLLDDEYMEARYIVVHGLCRLMAVGKLKSVKVLSRLIVVWFHPASRDAVEIRSCLNFFFPFFVKKCKWSLQIFEEAFIPTMEILFEAPSHNPISDIDQKGVVKVLCDLTNPNFISEENQPSENIHYNLAVIVCKCIAETETLDRTIVLLKALDYLNLSSIHYATRTTINNLLVKIIRKFKMKHYKKLIADIEKFKFKLNTMAENTRGSVCESRA